MLLEIISYGATLLVLVSYAYMVKTGNERQFNTINFISAFPLVLLGIKLGAIPNAILSASFGIIGAAGITKAWKNADKERREPDQTNWPVNDGI